MGGAIAFELEQIAYHSKDTLSQYDVRGADLVSIYSSVAGIKSVSRSYLVAT